MDSMVQLQRNKEKGEKSTEKTRAGKTRGQGKEEEDQAQEPRGILHADNADIVSRSS